MCGRPGRLSTNDDERRSLGAIRAGQRQRASRCLSKKAENHTRIDIPCTFTSFAAATATAATAGTLPIANRKLMTDPTPDNEKVKKTRAPVPGRSKNQDNRQSHAHDRHRSQIVFVVVVSSVQYWYQLLE